ncbi:MAG: hypothetical protein AAGI67_09965 [Pseudomonadota bacterium]
MSAMQKVIGGNTSAPSASANGRRSAPRRFGNFLSGSVCRALCSMTTGIALGVTALAASALLSGGEQLRVLAALAAGFGVIQLWLAVDRSQGWAALLHAGVGLMMVALSGAALPGAPVLVAIAYLVGAASLLAHAERAEPVLFSSAWALLTLALLGPGLGG